MVKRAPTPTGPEVILTSISAPAIEKFRYGGLRPLMYSNILLPLFRNVTFVWGKAGEQRSDGFHCCWSENGSPKPLHIVERETCGHSGRRESKTETENRWRKFDFIAHCSKWGTEVGWKAGVGFCPGASFFFMAYLVEDIWSGVILAVKCHFAASFDVFFHWKLHVHHWLSVCGRKKNKRLLIDFKAQGRFDSVETEHLTGRPKVSK